MLCSVAIGGDVTVDASCTGSALRIVVADEGPGLSYDMAALLSSAEHIAAPSRESKGLGLWTTGTLIKRLNGAASVEGTGSGTRIVITLPIGSEGARHAA